MKIQICSKEKLDSIIANLAKSGYSDWYLLSLTNIWQLLNITKDLEHISPIWHHDTIKHLVENNEQ